jgi:hypothetical protein
MSSSEAGISAEGGLVDLLVCMASAACDHSLREEGKGGGRRVSGRPPALTPYPTVCLPSQPGEPIIDPAKKDFALVAKLLEQLSVRELMLSCRTADGIEGNLQARDPLLAPLLDWLISSNRYAHIVYVVCMCYIHDSPTHTHIHSTHALRTTAHLLQPGPTYDRCWDHRDWHLCM